MKSGALAVAVVTGAIVLTAVYPPLARAQGTGVVEGTVTLAADRTRKTAARYPAGGPSIHGMQGVPAVVYLTGRGLPASVETRTVEVAQRDTAFAPAAIAVPTGTTVRFPNRDPFFHNVFSYAGNARFDLGRYPEGEVREFTFEEAGIARVFCEVHEFMRAVVVVTDHPFAAVVSDDGTFRLEGVPAGEYTAVAYQPDWGRVEERVVVGAGGVVSLDLRLGG